VQNTLNYEIRKLEAELMKAKEVTDQKASTPTQQEPKKIIAPKNYEVKLQNYGNILGN